MKKLLLAAVIASAPLLASATDINVNLGGMRIQAPGVTVTFGSQDNRGYYWDGQDYRHPDYWRKHEGYRGERYYTGRGHDEGRHEGKGHCPPGQAKKGNC
ncbi:DUF2502 domain-containing protein [Dechloromonas sp. HYN0024]|uniref:DUF2502 domain-containing protein n=1 Tax=Dechloromonas sp. HYN0024 TaxID=2231055 RepID=UPI000E433964|nr:DUF2502 domain-containing protein [Dechloromonas sp. HYN0024]AXS79881.1 DUF2502 domain-containing protein [Dechloromonas sp. HYN0024]